MRFQEIRGKKDEAGNHNTYHINMDMVSFIRRDEDRAWVVMADGHELEIDIADYNMFYPFKS